MILKNIRINTLLRLGLGLILALVILLGAVALVQTNFLWSQTELIYKHPLQVSRAVGQLKADIENMRRAMRDLLLADNDQEMIKAQKDIEVSTLDAARQFEVVYDRYLGPRSDISSLEDDFVEWKIFQEELVQLAHAGRKDQALAQLKRAHARGQSSKVLVEHIQTISDFARNMGDKFYRQATLQNDSLKRHLVASLATILLVCIFISWFLMRRIRKPLADLTRAANEFRLGELDSRSEYVAENEFGALSAAFNEMAETVETQMFINEQAALITGMMLQEREVRTFFQKLIKELLEHTASQSGAVYLLNKQETLFEHFESIGLSDIGHRSFSASTLEGEFGAALATGVMQRISDIPEDTRSILATVSGDYLPREIITLPLFSDGKVVAMISLSSIQNYEEKAIRFLETIVVTVTARMNGLLAYRQVQELAKRLGQQNMELNSQKQELIAQANELSHQNTELEMQKNQLDAANRLKSTFLSNMSHELRTPLNSVIALSSVLGRRLAGKIPKEEVDYLEVIERNGRHLLSLINDILDLSRIESGRIEISPSCFSLRMLMGEVLEMIDPEAREKGIALQNQIDENLQPITTDPEKLRHIVQNLVSNAVKFTETGSVVVSVQLVEDQIHIAVRDTGIGIAAEHLPHIFEEFRQADEGTSRRYGGTGLGLAIAKKYANLLLGDITVESTPGKGSTFTLCLPTDLCRPDAEVKNYLGRSAGTVSDLQDIGPGRGQCILLVEDSEPAVVQMTDILTEHGYLVEVARDGSDALAYVEGCLPDAVILDLMMPGMDGFEVLRQIRSTDRTAPLPVLILTAKHVTQEELSFLTGNNIHQLIQKGDINQSQLLATVAKMVAQSEEKLTAPTPGNTGDRPHRLLPLVLVVEDNPDNLKTARAILEERYTVIDAADGLTAIELAREHRPDLILMDIALPVMDGFSALAALRQDEVLRHIPVVAVTASAMKGDREEILGHGFDGYVSKPIDEKKFMQLLQKVIHGGK